MKRKKDDDPPPPKAKRNKGEKYVRYIADMAFIKGSLAVNQGYPSLFAQTQINLFN